MKQHCLITGAGSGIGLAVVKRALRDGATVSALDRDAEALERLVSEHVLTGSLTPIICDVASSADMANAFDVAAQWAGVPTQIFANAGIEVNRAAHQITDSDWERVIEVNLSGVFRTVRAGLQAMVAGGVSGSIVCTSSPAAFVGFAGGGNGAYAASKGGISAFVRAAAIDAAAYGIRVNAVVPGATDTPMLLFAEESQRVAEHRRILEAAERQVPLGRLADPDEIAAAVLWLLSSGSSYVTGSHLVVDGGLMAKSANNF